MRSGFYRPFIVHTALSSVLTGTMRWSILVIFGAFTLSASEPIKRDAKVIIVGAGVSGFSAAVTLLEHNVTEVLVLEASDRIGGRIHTVQFGGVPIDKGAEFVVGEVDNAVFELVSPHNFLKSYYEVLQDEMFLFANTSGHVFNSSYVKPLIDRAFEIFFEENIKNHTGSIADYFYPRLEALLNESNVEPYLREALRFTVPLFEESSSAADSIEETGIREYSEYKENKGDDLWKWKTGGYITLFDILSKKFPNASEELPVKSKIKFDKQVTRIGRRGEGGVNVKCADGSSYLADHVIVTASVGVLKKHAATMFDPLLPAEKTALIEKIGFGCLGKVFILFPTRWWSSNITVIQPLFSNQELEQFQATTVYGNWSSYTTGFMPVINHERMMCVWLSGQACRTMDTLSDQQITDALLELLDNLVGKTHTIPKPEAILRSSWATYPHTLGSYSYRSVESDALNLNYSILAQPILNDNGIPVILFAGEATHPYNFATVHGALSTGRREARRIINHYADHKSTIN